MSPYTLLMHEYERDDSGKIELPDNIHTAEHASAAALALAEYFDGQGHQDDTLAGIADSLHSVLLARLQTRYDNSIPCDSRYGARVTFVDDDGKMHTALVMEPGVTSMDAKEAWDPQRGELVNPKEAYPHGTVQLIYTPDYDLSDGFNFDRKSDLEVATSVTPASGPDDTYCYYPGWDSALDE